MRASSTPTIWTQLPRLVSVLLSLTCLSASVAAQVINVGPASGLEVLPGNAVSVPIVVDMSGAAGLDIASLQFTVTWDPALLTYQSSTDLSGGWAVTLNETDVGSGSLAWAGYQFAGMTSTFSAVALNFQAASVVTNSRTTVAVAVAAAGDELGTDISSFVQGESSSLCIGIRATLGDVNHDGFVNIIDAQQIARYAIGLPTIAPDMLLAGDVTEDGNINIIDAQQTAAHSVGYDTSLNAPNISVSTPGCGGGFMVTAAVVSYDGDMNAACQAEFGASYRLADWNEVTAEMALGTPPEDIVPLSVESTHGSRDWSRDNPYIISSVIHQGYAVWDSYTNSSGTMWLGSWPGSYQVLCYQP